MGKWERLGPAIVKFRKSSLQGGQGVGDTVVGGGKWGVMVGEPV